MAIISEKNYILPPGLKKELRKIWGFPIFGRKEEIAQKYENLIKKKKYQTIISIGDCCSLNLYSDVKIFDGRIRRKKIKNIPRFHFKVKNPPGLIKKEVWPKIEKAIKEKKNIFVEGEEDLLVMPAILLSKKNTAIVYGFPQKGICLIEISPSIKKEIRELFKKFWTN